MRYFYLLIGKFRRALYSRPFAAAYKVARFGKPHFECPVCSYQGPFCDDRTVSAHSRNVHCPSCCSNVRLRLQWLALNELAKTHDLQSMSVCHFSPEPKMAERLRRSCQSYVSAGIAGEDEHADLTDLPFKDGSYDFVFASHILEHIKDDGKAITEIRRILRPGGIAILPVPIVSDETIEYPEPNPYEDGHVRAPGRDYFDKYKQHFRDVKIITSADFDERFQLYDTDDRSKYPTEKSPLRKPVHESAHSDYVPICVA